MLDKPKGNRQLQIFVKAKELFNAKIDPSNQEKVIDDCIALVENGGLGNEFGDKNRDFMTAIYDGFNMKWSIELSDKKEKLEGYKVVLESISKNGKPGNPSFFTKNPIYPNKEGNIVGTVSGDNIPDKREEDYTIYFRVTKGPNFTTPVLPIDPKLQIRKR